MTISKRQHVGESLRDSHEIGWHSGSERSAVSQIRTITFHPRLGETRPRYGVTLIELLIVMLIITILASLILGVAAVAGETARESQSRLTVLRLHKLLMNHYDTYETRRVSVRPAVLEGINTLSIKPSEKGKLVAQARLYALRELMMMEVPDRWSDILLTEVPSNPNDANDALYPFYADTSGATATLGRTALASIYLRRYDAAARRNNSITGTPNTREEIVANQGAECLYLVITLATGDGEARSQFGEASIGDTDGDGAFEFLDGWDRPIDFLRAAPGFDSQVQINANQFDPGVNGPSGNTEWAKAASGDHDPFDIYRVDTPAFRLVPLVFSAGRDETFGVQNAPSYVVYQGLDQSALNANTLPGSWRVILPWASVDSGSGPRVYLGTAIVDGGSTDNVHNHLLGKR